jgi:hypothetical protein
VVWIGWVVVGVAMVFAAITLVRVVHEYRHIAALVRHPRLRIVHGLEHATVNVLAKQCDLDEIGGLSWPNAFQLELAKERDPVEVETLVRAAIEEAIARVATGEHALVYSPRCSTSAAAGKLVLSIATLGAGAFAWTLSLSLGLTIVALLAALDAATTLNRFLGILAQRWFTVSTAFSSATVQWVHATRVRDEKLLVDVRIDVEPAARAGGTVSFGPWA